MGPGTFERRANGRLSFDVTIVEIIREGGEHRVLSAGEVLREGDTLLVIGTKDDVLAAGRSRGLGFRREMGLHGSSPRSGGLGYAESSCHRVRGSLVRR